MILEYNFTFQDFKEAVEFSTKYYLNPMKVTTGRTTGEPRGLGSILDSFTLGKLTEVGVKKIIDINSDQSKKVILDFDIKTDKGVTNKPDILFVKEDTEEYRDPNFFIEIKNTSDKDRWIGLTEEQYNTIKRNSSNKNIYFIYASITSDLINDNPRTADLSGMFFKEIENTNKSNIFQEFSNLNARCQIEFIISSDDLDEFAYPFDKGMKMYETRLFQKKKKNSIYTINGNRKDIISESLYENILNESISPYFNDPEIPDNIKVFNISGTYKLYNKKSTVLIECLTDVFVENGIFGRFTLEQGCIYEFKVPTLGINPILKRNNLFISKLNLIQLIEKEEINNPRDYLKLIVDQI